MTLRWREFIKSRLISQSPANKILILLADFDKIGHRHSFDCERRPRSAWASTRRLRAWTRSFAESGTAFARGGWRAGAGEMLTADTHYSPCARRRRRSLARHRGHITHDAGFAGIAAHFILAVTHRHYRYFGGPHDIITHTRRDGIELALGTLDVRAEAASNAPSGGDVSSSAAPRRLIAHHCFFMGPLMPGAP